MATSLMPQGIYGYLVSRGYSPIQAAALTGNIQQESDFNPTNLNQKEGAFGLLQWRGSRLKGLQNYAAATGRSPSDPTAQLDYIGVEMGGPERSNASAFYNADDLNSANGALKNYIRYGDNSIGARLNYAKAFLPDAVAQGSAPPVTQAQPPQPAQQQASLPPADQQPSQMNTNFPIGMFQPQPAPYAPPSNPLTALAMSAPPQAQPLQMMNSMRGPVDLSGLASLLQNAPASVRGLVYPGIA